MKTLSFQLFKHAIVLLFGLAPVFCVQAGTILNVSKVECMGTTIYIFGENHYDGNAEKQYNALKSFFDQLEKNNLSYTLFLEFRRTFREKVKGVYKKVELPQSQGYFKKFYKDFITKGVDGDLSSSISLVYEKNGNVTQNFDTRRQNYIEKHAEVLAQIKDFLGEIIESDNGFDTDSWNKIWNKIKQRIPNVKQLNLEGASTKCFGILACFNEKNKKAKSIYTIATEAIENFKVRIKKEKDLENIYDDFTGTLISFVEKNCEFGFAEQWEYINKVITNLDKYLLEVNICIADLDLWKRIGKAIDDKKENDCIIVHCGNEHLKAVMKCFGEEKDATVVGSIDCTQYTNSPALEKELLELLCKSGKQNTNNDDSVNGDTDDVSGEDGTTDNGETATGENNQGEVKVDSVIKDTAHTSVRWYKKIANKFSGFFRDHKYLSIFGGAAFLGAAYCYFQYLKG